MQELEDFVKGISADVVSVSATHACRPSTDLSCDDYGFETIRSDNSVSVGQGSSGAEQFGPGLAISSALSSLPSRPVQHFWENSFWDVMLGDSHSVMDVFSSGVKRPLPVRPDDGDDGGFSDLGTKEKEREKEKVTLQEMRVIGLKMNGKEMRQRIGMKAIGPMKMKQRGNPKPGMNGKKIVMMITDTSKEKERKERKEKEIERKVMDLKTKEKDKVMGKEKQTM